jgi:hypothetical protein
MEEAYLGDGLYASFDGFAITLRAPRPGGDHWVALEPDVYAELLRFVAKLKKEPEK